jgi:hypothetical protein
VPQAAANPPPLCSIEERRQRVHELLVRQEKLKADLALAKTTLMVDPESWSYDCTYYLWQM